jgi:hypothetical protein
MARTPKADLINALQKSEDDICERTLARLREQAEALGTTVDALLPEVIPETRARLTDYMKRKAQGTGFAKFVSPVSFMGHE